MVQLPELLGQLAQLEQLEQLGQLAKLVAMGDAQPILLSKRMRRRRALPVALRGRLQLLVMQPTPFCNLDCDYCYLPDRNDKRRMGNDVLEATAHAVFEQGLAASDLGVVWHAGEPLVLPCAWYEDAIATLARHCPSDVRLTHHFQTNATLIDDEWCRFFSRDGIRVGVSIDGPAWLHDQHRRTRSGGGTHAAVMRGIDRLKQHGLPFHAICVLTRQSLPFADELFDFFVALRPTYLCLNIEEMEGVHDSSTLTASGTEEAFYRFFSRFLDRHRANPEAFQIREVDDVLKALRHPEFGKLHSNSQNAAFEILSVGCDGSFSSFSPELLGLRHPVYETFALGNVLSDDFADTLDAPHFRRISEEIQAGIERCKASCKYFSFCRGGAPANKLGELGSFSATETLFCRLTQKSVIDVVLTNLERDLPSGRGNRWLATPP